VDEIGGRLRQDSHGMAFQGNRKAVIRLPVRTGAGTVDEWRVIYDVSCCEYPPALPAGEAIIAKWH
jgi:hypothetical protein